MHKLPEATVRQLGATLLVVDPVSAVKELLDNAIDAKASNINIEIARNTINSLQVRDNGTGIHPDDRESAFFKYHTSKIRSFDDIRALGGTTLGFRGEALSGLAEVCRQTIVTTRIEEEKIAFRIEYGRNGVLNKPSPASQPTGSTVRLIDMFHCLPVRREMSIKDSSKSLAAIKSLLQAYSLARPSIRFSLRVLNLTPDKADYVFAPKTGESIGDVVTKIFGRNCSAQCTQSFGQHQGFELRGFLARPDADLAYLSGLGQFISIDFRPVSSDRGLFSEMITEYKQALKRLRSGTTTCRNPFMELNISCPTGCYDPNIEPAKDDLLFDDPEIIRVAWRQMLEVLYPSTVDVLDPAAGDASATQGQTSCSAIDEDLYDDFQPLSRSVVETTVRENSPQVDNDIDEELPLLAARHAPAGTYHTSMFDYDDEDIMMLNGTQPSQQTVMASAIRPSTASSESNEMPMNPWILAKLNSRIEPRGSQQRRQSQVDADIERTEEHTMPPPSSFARSSENLPRGHHPPVFKQSQTPEFRGFSLSPQPNPQRGRRQPLGLLTPQPSSSPLRDKFGIPIAGYSHANAQRLERPSKARQTQRAVKSDEESHKENNWFDFNLSQRTEQPKRAKRSEKRRVDGSADILARYLNTAVPQEPHRLVHQGEPVDFAGPFSQMNRPPSRYASSTNQVPFVRHPGALETARSTSGSRVLHSSHFHPPQFTGTNDHSSRELTEDIQENPRMSGALAVNGTPTAAARDWQERFSTPISIRDDESMLSFDSTEGMEPSSKDSCHAIQYTCNTSLLNLEDDLLIFEDCQRAIDVALGLGEDRWAVILEATGGSDHTASLLDMSARDAGNLLLKLEGRLFELSDYDLEDEVRDVLGQARQTLLQ